MSGFYKPTDAAGQPLNTIYAEDVAQIIDVLTGQRDAGALSLLAPLAAPASAPAVTTSAGSLTGTYKWQVYWVSGVMDGTATAHVVGRTPAGPATSGTALSAQRATLDITGLSPPTGTIGWGVARTQAGGSTFLLVPGSEQFLSAAGSLPATFVDNVADGSLVTAVQTVNTTGTTLAANQLDYAQITASPPGITATTEGTAVAVITGNSTPFEGTRVKIEAFLPNVNTTVTGAQGYAVLLRDATVIGRASFGMAGNSGNYVIKIETFDTPPVGAHTYKLAMFTSTGTMTVTAGVGGAGNYLPGFLRILSA